MLLLPLLLIPLLTAILTYFSGKSAKYVSLAGSLLNLTYVLFLLNTYNTTGQETITFSVPWIPQLGVSFSLMLDGISLMLTILSAIVMQIGRAHV